MITEDYVSFEVAKLLKEKGFNTPLCCIYDIDGLFVDDHAEFSNSTDAPGFECVAPTHQMAMKWLREVHNLHIEVRYFPTPNIYRYVIIQSPATFKDIDSHPQYFNAYEEACEAAIKYSLENLIYIENKI
jgi:hypothetical protein